MAVKKLFVGDVSEYLADIAKSRYTNAFLLTSDNLSVIDDDDKHVCYTALGDLRVSKDLIWSILTRVDSIIYCSPAVWSDGRVADPSNIWKSVQGATEFFLAKVQSLNHNVEGLDLSHYPAVFTKKLDVRRGVEPQLWISGCSFSAGYGVQDHERYGYIVAQMIQRPVSWLAERSANVQFSADQILRADIRAGDIVIWGLTANRRFSLLTEDDQILHITAAHKQRTTRPALPETVIDQILADRTLFYQTIIHVHQVVNYCHKIEAKLLILGLLSDQETELYLSNVKEFVQFNRPNELRPVFLDHAINDPLHPGPQQHQEYANFCVRHLKKLNYI